MNKQLILFIVITLVSCRSDNDTYDLLQGSWRYEYEKGSIADTVNQSLTEYRFTNSSFYIDNGPFQAHNSYSWWTVENSKLQIFRADILQIDTIDFLIVNINEDSLELKDESDGLIFVLSRTQKIL